MTLDYFFIPTYATSGRKHMLRFSSLKHSSAETRRLLRDRFLRYLPVQYITPLRTAKGGVITLRDESLLELMLNLSIDFVSDFETARASYVASLPSDSSEPSLDDLIAEGWMRVVWGRISMPMEIGHAARSIPAGTMTAFATLLAKRFEQSYQMTGAVRGNPDLTAVIARIDRKEFTPRDIGCQNPEWIAARLWDRTLTDSADLSVALRVWVDRWQILGCPSLVPGRVWDETAANAFREAAINVIESEPSLVGWEETRASFVRQIALINRQLPASAEGYVPRVPGTLVDRALWFDHYSLERAALGTLGEFDDVFGLARLLLADVEVADNASAPHQTASRLIAMAIERPELFLVLLFKVRYNPVLLADLLFYPATSAVACLVIAQWQPTGGAWDRELRIRDDQTTKSIAFADAVSVMGSFLEQGSVGPEEVASLLDWMHSKAQPGFIDDLGNNETILATLRGELINQSTETLRKMVAALTASVRQCGLGTSTFAAALDIVDAGKLAGDIDPTPLVTAYIESVAAAHYSLSANRVSVAGAVSLFEMAMRAPPELRQKFFFPVDAKARLAAGVAANENPYTLSDTIAQSIRAHVRVLSRAIVGSIGAAPADLVNALVGAVRVGALKHDEKGRVAAFTARYESDPYRGSRDRPIAADLGAALAALPEAEREQLLSVILEIDEPMVLAQMLSFAPHATRVRLECRITELTPSEAGDIRSLTEAQARIEALLSAGLADAAAQFMEAEQDLKTFGKVAGRDMVRLRAKLRLQLLHRNWDGIKNTQPPPDLSTNEQASALETINFFKAVAALTNPDGDRQAAEQMFAQLQHRHSDVVAYASNLFAARISNLLGDNAFVQLHDAALIRGRQVLAEAEQMMLHVRGASDADSEIFACNKALLLLALGQPERANEVLTSLHAVRLCDGKAAYTAVALARMGRTPEAIAILNQAVGALGDSEVLQAARTHVQNGTSFSGTANITSEDDPGPRIRDALLALSQMDHIRQAEMLQAPPEPFDTFVISHVRSAAASVISLVPMMKDVKLDSCEDDLSAVIRELLISRLQFLGWSIPDQPKGGFTAKGNPGERDLLIQKDSTTLAVIEAVVCDRPVTHGWTRQELTSHFQKLLGYSTCHLFFHLTYAFIEDPGSILPHLQSAVEQAVPSGFTYLRREEIPFTDSRPVGLIAHYTADFGEVKVIFLILNMGQHRQKYAAKIAETNNPRNRKSKL